jgi:phosphoribosylformimino-5-aminoimidazole carboxamide ribotide isomerase
MGTAAVRDPELLAATAARNPGRVLAALDLRQGRPAVTGWTAVEHLSLESLLAAWDAAALGGIVLTSVDRDGSLAGPDLPAIAGVRAATRHPVVYSGGVASLDDLDRLHEAGAAGVILGRSLLEGRFSLEEAMARCAA